MRRYGWLLVTLALIVPVGATPQDTAAVDTADVASDRQLRQRTNFALSRFANLYDELDAAEDHLETLLAEIDRRIVRDSLRQLAPGDTVVEPPDTTTEPDAPDAPATLSVSEVSRTDSTATYRGTWESVDGASSYERKAGLNAEADPGWTGVGDVTETAAPLVRGEADAGGYFCVHAVDSQGQAGEAACRPVTVPGTAEVEEPEAGVFPDGWTNHGGTESVVIEPGHLELILPEGLDDGETAAGPIDRPFAEPAARVETTFRLTVQGADGLYEHQSSGTKFLSFPFGDQDDRNNSFLYLRHPSGVSNFAGWPYEDRIHDAFRLQWTLTPIGGGYHEYGHNGSAAADLTVGQTYDVRIVLEGGTVGGADGRVRVWVDGALYMDHPDVPVLTSEGPTPFTRGHIDAIWGGNAGEIKGQTDRIVMDDLQVSASGVVDDDPEPTGDHPHEPAGICDPDRPE